ncbi:MAG: ROK family protein [Clostridium sp.]|nr:ROK family protein [Clostridium sp.]
MERAERVVLGIDVGGTKVCVGAVMESGRVVDSLRYPHRNCPVEEWAKELMERADCLLERCGMRERIAAVGIGSRGHVDHRSQRLLSTTIMKLNPDYDLCRALREKYGRPVYIDNDVKAVACAEIVFGAGRECKDFVCYNVGTGIAAASVAEGRLIRGRDNNAGEIAADRLPAGPGPGAKPENRADDPAPWSAEPSSRTAELGTRPADPSPGLEAAASGRGIEDQAKAELSVYPDSTLAPLGNGLTARDVLAACREGDELAGKVVGRALHMLAASVVNIRHLLDPERFVFVGGVISDPWFFEQLQRTVRELSGAAGERWDAVLQVSELGIKHAGLLGAASVAFYNMKQSEQTYKEV